MISANEIGYECEIQENTSVEELRKNYNNCILIWINGSGASPNGNPGKYRCVLDFNGHVRYLEKQFPGATANEAMINGAIDATKCINKSMRLYIISSTALGFTTGFKGKGPNGALIQKLYEIIKEKKCELTEVQFINSGDAIKKFVLSCNPDKTEAGLYNSQQERKKEYKDKYIEMIYKECLLKVERVLIKNNVDFKILNEVKKIKP